jgi:hypothetical protein
MRSLVLQHQSVPMLIEYTAGPIRQRILDYPPDDVELWNIWEVWPSETMRPSVDITVDFAKTWAMECAFEPGTEPDQYLRSVPAFILEHAREELIRIWQRRRAEHEPDFMPAVLASARVAA